MQMYHLALFFAVVGAVAGIVDYTMDGMGGDNWFDTQVQNMSTVTTTSSDVDSMAFEEGSTFEIMESTPKFTNVLWNAIGGVLNITSMLGKVLYWDVGGVNVFQPVLTFFQAIIYLIYVIGTIQFIMNRSTRGME